MEKALSFFGLLICLTGIVICSIIEWRLAKQVWYQNQLMQVTATVRALEQHPIVPEQLLKQYIFRPNALLSYTYEINGRAFRHNDYVYDEKVSPLYKVIGLKCINKVCIGDKRKFWYHPEKLSVLLEEKKDLSSVYIQLGFVGLLIVGFGFGAYKAWQGMDEEEDDRENKSNKPKKPKKPKSTNSSKSTKTSSQKQTHQSKTEEAVFTISGLQADGSFEVGSGQEVFAFNKPIPDPNDGKREYDALKVAQGILTHYANKPLDQNQDTLFLEALWLTLENNPQENQQKSQALPTFKKTSRRHLATLAKLAIEADYQSAFDLVKSQKKETEARMLQRNIEPLFVATHPTQTAEFLLECRHYPNYPLIKSLASQAEHSLILSLVDNEADEVGKVEVLGHALQYALDAGQNTAELEQRWHNLAIDATHQQLHQTWQGLEVGRVARQDIAKAETLYNSLCQEFAPPEYVQMDFFRQLAKADPEKVLDTFYPEAEIFDVLPGLIGCHQAGVDIGPKLNQLFQNFTKYAYRPHSAMGWLLKAGILRNDVEFVEQVLEKGGPKGWQVAVYASTALHSLATNNPTAAKALLPTLMKPRKAGFVAGRDANMGMVVGTAVFRPQFLDFDKPKPVESLTIYAALEGRGPRWHSNL